PLRFDSGKHPRLDHVPFADAERMPNRSGAASRASSCGRINRRPRWVKKSSRPRARLASVWARLFSAETSAGPPGTRGSRTSHRVLAVWDRERCRRESGGRFPAPKVTLSSIASVLAEGRRIRRGSDGEVDVLGEMNGDAIVTVNPHRAHGAGAGLALPVH